jgi:sugar phosphate isomerase/epimerase
MSLPVAVQLYSVRDALAEDFVGVVTKIAEMGYAGVETAGFPGVTPEAAAKLFSDLQLTVVGAHSRAPVGENKNAILDTMAGLGCERLIVPWAPPEDFQTADGVKRLCDMLNEAETTANAHSMSLYYHNHAQEFQMIDGRYAYQVMVDYLSPTIQFEIDTYWVKFAGADPMSVLQELGKRVPLVHVKDGPLVKDSPDVAIGDGALDWHSIIPAATSAEWLIVELDRCATDMLEAVERSLNYLTAEGFGHGR